MRMLYESVIAHNGSQPFTSTP
eukprot:COSAG02_NODE_2942_length_7692_cov_3.853154_1_plen_21_part_10